MSLLQGKRGPAAENIYLFSGAVTGRFTPQLPSFIAVQAVNKQRAPFLNQLSILTARQSLNRKLQIFFFLNVWKLDCTAYQIWILIDRYI